MPIGRCYRSFDGQGDVVGLEDPGVMQAAYDYCPTGNEADLASTILTAVALGNPLRQYAAVYDDLTKDYFFVSGMIKEDSNGTGTQRNCDNPFDPLLCAAPTPGPCFGPFGCTVVPGILKAFCDLGAGIFCSPDEGGGGAAASIPATEHGAERLEQQSWTYAQYQAVVSNPSAT